MTPKANGDPLFPADSRRCRLLVRIGMAATAAMLGTFSLRAVPAWARPPAGPPAVALPVPMASVPRASDRFVITAPARLDSAMVVKAREDLDPQMVLRPEVRHRGRAPADPVRILVRPLPAGVPARAVPR